MTSNDVVCWKESNARNARHDLCLQKMANIKQPEADAMATVKTDAKTNTTDGVSDSRPA
jgi:hypothetical protein